MIRGTNPDGSESLFIEMDLDKSGTLDKQELKAGLTGMLGVSTGDELDKMLASASPQLDEMGLIELLAKRNARKMSLTKVIK